MTYGKYSGKRILSSKFDLFWLSKIRELKISNNDNFDHNKLRVYRQFKSSFNTEPNITIIRNRNQRPSLSRLRISAHCLATELGRRTRPVTPYNQRVCAYCRQDNQDTKFIDTEIHFLLFCDRFNNSRNCFFTKVSLVNPLFPSLTPEQKFLTLVCPTTPRQTKLVNRFIKLMFEKRGAIDSGEILNEM